MFFMNYKLYTTIIFVLGLLSLAVLPATTTSITTVRPMATLPNPMDLKQLAEPLHRHFFTLKSLQAITATTKFHQQGCLSLCKNACAAAVGAIPRSPLAIVSPLLKLGRAYNQWLVRAPFTANLISGVGMVVMGDIISQVMEQKAAKGLGQKLKATFAGLDGKRVYNAALPGIVFNGVLAPQWYVLLHKWLPVETPKTIAVKIFANCVAWGCAGNGLAMLTRRVLDGAHFNQAVEEVKKDLPEVMKTDYKIFPFYDVLCFSLIPRHTQALSSGLLDVAWSAYMSNVLYANADNRKH